MKPLLAVLLVAFSSVTFAASFDCARARSTAEKLVCGDPELSDFDDTMARYYRGAMEALKENGACLREDQLRWLGAKRAPCNSSACVRDVYLKRLGELFAIQPGINTQRKLPLPAVPSLVWAMAPLPEESPDLSSRQAWIEGNLAYEGGTVGGYVVRTHEGKPFILLSDMMRGGSNETALTSLVQTASGGKFAARGRVANEAGQSPPFFDHRSCVYIYRLPD